jgi:hypothetical protein
MNKEPVSRNLKQALLEMAPHLTTMGFYLAGGTAVAIHLHHRRSIDLDWFTPDLIHDPLALAHSLNDQGMPFETSRTAPGTLHGTVLGVQVSLLQYRYPLLMPLVESAEYHCQLASLSDLACMKLAAIAQRGAKKDFIDVYAIGKTISLEEMLHLYRQKYQVADIVHILQALSYFDDADQERTPVMLWEVGWREVKKALRSWVSRLS